MKLKSVIVPFFFIILISSSCMVSKKKYEALDANRKKSIDSLALILNNTRDDYNKQRQIYAHDAKVKDSELESLLSEIKRLSRDTSTLNESLKIAIGKYDAERKKLIGVEAGLNKKIRQIDSLQIEQDKKQLEINELQKSLLEKQKRLSQLEAMIEANKEEANNLKKIINDALKSFDNSELNVYIKDGKVYVAMEEKLLFKTGSAVIDKRGKEAIIKLGKILETNTETEILIEGHTDNVGSDKLNWKLSNDRALSVVDILTENTSISAARITASGRGMHKSVADNATAEGKQKNRRIEIILVPKLDSLYKIMNE